MTGPDEPGAILRQQPDAFSAEAIVRDAYVALLNRQAEPAGLREHAEDIRRYGVAHVLRRIFNSEECLGRLGLGARMKVGLAGNCNATVLAECLRGDGRLLAAWVADVTRRGAPGYVAAAEAIAQTAVEYVLAQPIVSQAYPEIRTDRLQALYGERLVTFTNLHFEGLQPDMYGPSHVRQSGHQSPLGDWHSGLVVACFLQGLPAVECVRRFDGKTYERLGFFGAYERSAAELRARDASVTVRFADEFLAMTETELTMLTTNHPTSPVFAALARRIATHLGLDNPAFSPDAFANELEHGPVWPVYPEIAEALGLPYRTRLVFQQPGSGRQLTLEEFVAESYTRYDHFDAEDMRSSFAPLLAWAV